uniref:Uncharacterized protein n=1 Tax=Anguilla anguilla TaxID=7936 RepID=A0A0E9W3T7_ANGAN
MTNQRVIPTGEEKKRKRKKRKENRGLWPAVVQGMETS